MTAKNARPRNGQHAYHSTAVTPDTRDKLDLIKRDLERKYGKLTYSDVIDELCDLYARHDGSACDA